MPRKGGGKKYSESSSSGGLAPGAGGATRAVEAIGNSAKKRAGKITRDLEAKSTLNKLRTFKYETAQSRVPGAPAPRKDEYAWPANYEGPTTFEDQVRAIKLQSINPQTGATPFGVAQSSDKDWVWAAKKLQLLRAIEYDKLFIKMWDMTSPLEVAEARRIYPEYFENRKKIIRLIAEMQTQLACIFLTGYKDKSDVDFLIELRMMNCDKDKNGIPLFLTKPVWQLNHEEAIKVIASTEETLGGVDVSQMLSKTNTDAAAPHRTAFGFLITPNNDVNRNQMGTYSDFFKMGAPQATGMAGNTPTGSWYKWAVDLVSGAPSSNKPGGGLLRVGGGQNG